MNHREDWLEWTERRDRQIGAPDGPLSLTALHWLDDVDTSYPEVPGTWRAAGELVVVTASTADGLSLDGQPVAEVTTLDPSDDLRIQFADGIIEVIRRSGSPAIRVRDPQAPARLAFSTLPRYDFDADWRLMARFEPYPQAQTRQVGSVVEGVSHETKTLGEVVFEVDGTPHRLVVFGESDRFWVLFRDRTSGVTTAGAARSMALPEPAADGSTIVDFNRAGNLPCAYNDFSTCPVPLPENRLDLAVTAGEQLLN